MSSQSESSGANILEQAEAWSDQQIEDRLQDLLDYIRPVLLDSESEYELRLDCVRVTADKIARFVPVFEAEDNVFHPVLTGVLEFLHQVFQSVSRAADDHRVMLLSVATALVEHTDTLLINGTRYEGLGPAEIPSIPRLIPKILLSTFRHCCQEQSHPNPEVKDAITLLFLRGRTLLEHFAALVEKMRIRSVLEDELDLVVELCGDLLTFHQVLFSVDLKSALCVWKLYCKLAKEHSERLRLKLDVEAALMVLLREGLQTFRKLDLLLQEESEDTKKLNRLVISLTCLVRLASSLAEEYSNSVGSNLEELVHFLGFMFMKGENMFPHLDWGMVDKLNRDLYLPNPAEHLVLKLPDLSQLAKYLSVTKPSSETGFTYVQIILCLLDSALVPAEEHMDLVDALLAAFSLCETENQRASWIESVEAEGLPVTAVGSYEWVLTKVCRYISVLSPEEFPALESVLFKHLVGESSLTSQICCDIICFIGRLGSAELCLSHLELVSELCSHLNPGYFSLPGMWLESLLGRLFNFLGPNQKQAWAERFSPVEPRYMVLWSKINLGAVGETETLKLLADVSVAQYNRVFEDFSDPISPTVLIHILDILNQLEKLYSSSSYKYIVFTLWQRIAESWDTPSSEYWSVMLLNKLTDLTVSLMPRLAVAEVRFIISHLRVVAGSSRGAHTSNNFLVWNLISVLQQIPNLSWVTQIENVDPCLVTEVGNLSTLVLRTAVKNPVLRGPGFRFLRALAERSSNPGFIRLCSDEKDVMPHFTLFLNRQANFRKGEDASVKFNYAAPGFESFLNRKDDPPGLEIKRKISTPTLSPQKKRVRRETSDKPAAEIISRIEADLAALEQLLSKTKAVNLTTSEIDRLKRITVRADQLIDPK